MDLLPVERLHLHDLLLHAVDLLFPNNIAAFKNINSFHCSHYIVLCIFMNHKMMMMNKIFHSPGRSPGSDLVHRYLHTVFSLKGTIGNAMAGLINVTFFKKFTACRQTFQFQYKNYLFITEQIRRCPVWHIRGPQLCVTHPWAFSCWNGCDTPEALCDTLEVLNRVSQRSRQQFSKV